jgi:uncharacterized membrane protein HdeD (DUF308 family)
MLQGKMVKIRFKRFFAEQTLWVFVGKVTAGTENWFEIKGKAIGILKGQVAGVRSRLWALLLEGVIGLAAGIGAVIWPQIAIIIFIYIIAVWAVATGIVEIIAAINLRKILNREWLLFVGGIGSIALGALLFIFPNLGVAALILIIGIYAVLFGLLLLGLAFVLLSSPQPQQAG